MNTAVQINLPTLSRSVHRAWRSRWPTTQYHRRLRRTRMKREEQMSVSPSQARRKVGPTCSCWECLSLSIMVTHCNTTHKCRVHSKLKGQNSRTFQGLLKDLKLQFSSTKIIHKKTYHTRATSKLEWNIYYSVLNNTALMIKADCWHKTICNPCETMKIWSAQQ